MAENTGHVRLSTRLRYEGGLAHAYRCFGRTPVSEIDENEIARLVSRMRKAGKAGWTIRATLTPVSRAMQHAVRRGWVGANPVAKLEKGERPKVGKREMRVLERDEIARLLDATTATWRPLFALLVFTGAWISEALALTWADVDLDAGIVRIRYQLDGTRELVAPKTEEAKRDVIIFPALGKYLREQRLAAPPELSGDDAFVFRTAAGRPQRPNNALRAFQRAAKRAGLEGNGRPKLRLHDCWHTFVSLLLAAGRDVVFVSRQVGHSSPAITLDRYSHLFDAQRHADDTRAALEASFGGLMETVLETYPRQPPATATVSAGAEVLAIPLR
jgi:integrase